MSYVVSHSRMAPGGFGSSAAEAQDEQYILRVPDALGTGALNSGSVTLGQGGHTSNSDLFSSASSAADVATAMLTALTSLATDNSLPAAPSCAADNTPDAGYLFQQDIVFDGANAETNVPDLSVVVSGLTASLVVTQLQAGDADTIDERQGITIPDGYSGQIIPGGTTACAQNAAAVQAAVRTDTGSLVVVQVPAEHGYGVEYDYVVIWPLPDAPPGLLDSHVAVLATLEKVQDGG